ncbi:transposase [Nitrosococcus watsonii]|uniref:transposase n=1 Tax=Nitrosococcus watsonii TaxID=473531 RepID=UPI0012FC0AF4
MIYKAGRTLKYLPAYSPVLNPIEQKWAHAKTIRQRIQVTIDNLFKLKQFI